jgi:hypothetical protein
MKSRRRVTCLLDRCWDGTDFLRVVCVTMCHRPSHNGHPHPSTTLRRNKSYVIICTVCIVLWICFVPSNFLQVEIGADLHNYNTRNKNQHRQTSHRIDISASLPQNLGPKLFIKLPTNLKQIETQGAFKKTLRKFLVEGVFYSVDEFLK